MTKAYKAFLYGMGFGALLMFLLLFPSTVKASDENGDTQENCTDNKIAFY